MVEHASRPNLFEPGRNCWRIEHASRAAFLIDADAYFKAFVAAARKAQRSILIVGWDFHSRTRLLCDDEGRELELGPFLNELVKRRRDLHIHVLSWDYPMIFGLDREWAPLYGLGWRPHHRVHLRYDNTHPVGGSHHQKIVVIDDRVAFCGGIDLTCRRWDTCEHAPQNVWRVMRGSPYPPFHDLAMAVEGEAAAALGELVRERWRKAAHHTPQPPSEARGFFRRMHRRKAAASRWPDALPADVSDVEVAIARTEPAINGSSGVREVEGLYLDMIAAARRSIYIENQYFTADKLGEALAARLQEEDGPELILVLRELSHGWLEELTMQTLRTRLMERLRAADLHGRLRVFYPYVDGLKSGTCIDVHSKMMIVDDEVVRIGSANLANRSMGLDTECDVTIAAQGREDVRAAIRGLRNRLLAEHLGAEESAVAAAAATYGSIAGAVEALRREDRTLKPLEAPAQISEAMLNVVSVADPEKPVELTDLVNIFNPEVNETIDEVPSAPAWSKIIGIVAVIGALTALWKFTPLAELLDASQVTRWARGVGRQWWAPLATVAAYTPAAFTMFPRPLITLFAVVAFGPLFGFVYAMAGIELSAWVTFIAGRKLNRAAVRRIAGAQLNKILDVLRRRGLLAITALRLVPLAPFAVEGVVAGAVHVKLWHFMLGTAIGVLPGVLTSTIFGDQLQVWIENPEEINYWLIGVALAVLGLATWLVKRWLVSSAPAAQSSSA